MGQLRLEMKQTGDFFNNYHLKDRSFVQEVLIVFLRCLS